jgi:mevalonate kinase
MLKIKSKSPTKIILIGEHSVVYGKTALVCAIDLYCSCEIKPFGSEGIICFDREDGFKEEYDIEEILNLRDNFSYRNKKDKFLQITLNTILKHLKINSFEPIEIKIEKEAPVGGCGISTSVIVSMAKALGRYFNKKLSEKDLFNIAMEAETKFHGYRSSGADQAAIIYGGLVKYQKKGKNFDCKKLNINSDILKNFLVINSGSPEVLTGEVVDFVRREKERNPAKAGKIFKNLENLTYNLVDALKKNNKEQFYNIIDKAGEELIELGIVTPDTQKLISDIKKLGGHVKVSGAGAHKGKGSGALVCFSDNREKIEEYLKKNKIDFYEVNVTG